MSKIIVFLLLFFILPLDSFALKVVREGNILAFYNQKGHKVKAYYTLNNKVIYVYRYYYDNNNLCVRKETWKKNSLINFLTFKYHENGRLKEKHYYKYGKLKFSVYYSTSGDIINKVKHQVDKEEQKEDKKERKNKKETKKQSSLDDSEKGKKEVKDKTKESVEVNQGSKQKNEKTKEKVKSGKNRQDKKLNKERDIDQNS